MMGIAWDGWGNVCKGCLRNRMSKGVGFILLISLSLCGLNTQKALCKFPFCVWKLWDGDELHIWTTHISISVVYCSTVNHLRT